MKFSWKVLAWWVFVLFGLALTLVLIADGVAMSESPVTYPGWILCSEGGQVNVRSGPDTDHEIIGHLYAGDLVTCDRVTERGWVHVIDLPFEMSSGYVYVGYVVVEEPERVDAMMCVRAEGRVAAYSHMCSGRTMWLQPGTEVEVSLMGEGWAVTSAGFVRAKWLEVEDDQ